MGSFRFFGLGAVDRGRLGYPAGETGGLNLWRHALRAILFGWAWFVTPAVFGVASPTTLRQAQDGEKPEVGVNYWMHACGVRPILCDVLYQKAW